MRARSPERKRQAIAGRGKWDEGFGGVYLPTGGVGDGVLSSSASSSRPTVGPLPLRKLTVNGIKKEKSASDVVDWFSGEILRATGHSGLFPVVGCQFLTAVGAVRNALVEFRTPAAASVALTVMQGKEGLKIKRPRDFPPEESPSGTPEDQLNTLTAEAIGGPEIEENTSQLCSLSGDLSRSGRISVYGLPGNLLPEQIVRDLFCQFGKLKSVQLDRKSVV